MNQAFTIHSLSRQVRQRDYEDKRLEDNVFLDLQVRNSAEIATNGFNKGVSTKAIIVNAKTAYSTTELDEKLVLRKAASNIQNSIEISFDHRDKISSELICFLKEGVKYRIYRLDITSFFESISIKNVTASLAPLQKLSSQSKDIIIDYLVTFQSKFNVSGIPRGTELSSVLSELVLHEFDKNIKAHNDVFYYARYVDDIVIITSASENKTTFLDWVQEKLPEELKLNNRKQDVLDLTKKSKNLKPDITFEFLGYKYKIGNPKVQEKELPSFRPIEIDLSVKKIKLFKTKIAKAFVSFKKSKDFELLYDRLAFLSSNRDITTSKNSTLGTGIYYSYKKINPKLSLKLEVDKFLRQNSISKSYKFTKAQRVRLLKLSFFRGFQKRIQRKYSPYRLGKIVELWR